MKSSKAKRPIQLTRIVAVNWYGFNQVIEVDGNIVITGEYGTGKSVLLDLIQRVLLGSATRFNRAATGDASSRKLKGYCLCDTNTLRDGESHFTRSSGVTVIGLEFTWPLEPGKEQPRRETWGMRVEYSSATDEQALSAFTRLARLEGIIPALESSHAVAALIERAPKMSKEDLVIVNLSGRGDKDVSQVASLLKL